MYLKTLYIQGFKSFANKTKIDFNNRITGVVGPNGSGKSNISDAIMWVLGETSVKSLRGSKMEDVIFSGTDKRKPLGFAEVTIVFDNSDNSLPIKYNEVSVTRRMYRSLESEFLINNVKCRLKDIKELFMDTGIGKDGYSLIGQGRIENILSSKPEQRRAIFEEAAGISKFKMKKTESERKLQKTKENLIRLNDIISEIEKRTLLLESQSEKAIKYKELFEKLKNLEITVSYMEINNKNNSIKNFEEELINLEKNLEKILKEVELSKSNQEKLNEDIKLNDENLNISQNKELEENRIYENLNSQLELIQEKKKNTNKEIIVKKSSNQELENEIKSIDNKIVLLQENLEELLIEENSCKDNKGEIEKKLSSLNHNYEKEEIKQNRSNEEYLDLHKKITDLDSKISMTETLLNEKKDRINAINKNLDILVNNNEELETSIDEITIKYNQAYEDNNDLIEKNTINENYLLELNKVVEKRSVELKDLKENYDEKKARFNAIKNLSDNYEGYSKSVKSFMNFSEKRGLFKNSLIGPVADKLIIDKKYEKAISVALGGNLQNIIIEKEQDAKAMISLLSKEKLGRVTFLPLDSIKFFDNKINLSNFKNNNILGFADELIEYDKKYENIFKSILGKIIVTEDFDSGVLLSKKLNRSYRIVTLNGDSLNVGGSISGGSIYNNNISILSRNKEIEDLGVEVNKLGSLYNDLLKEYNSKISKMEELKFSSTNIRNRINEQSREILSLENKVESLKNSKNNNQNYIDKYIADKNSYKESIESDFKNIEEYISLKKEYMVSRSNVEELNNSSKNIIDSFKNELNDLREELSNINIKYTKISAEIMSINKEIENNRELKEKNNKKVEGNLKDIASLEKNILNLEDTYKKVSEDFKISEENISKLINSSKELKISRENRYIELDSLRKKQEKLQLEISELEKNRNKIEYSIEKNKLEIENIINNLTNDYEIDENDIVKIVEIESLKKSRELIKENKKKISLLGEVNLLAVEEYESIKERLEFNLSQKQDLLDSMDEIKNILLELDKEMDEKFIKSFNEVSIYFNEIFKELFNGGKAVLEIDGENALTGGIEIKTQPPGKRFQSLSLLSGGERALTAVALLFALLHVRPAPFCILDEIDAALDDANIKRYTDYLLTLENIQFIMITHRKSTMEIANKLYGVTMEEKGISKLISVELTKEE